MIDFFKKRKKIKTFNDVTQSITHNNELQMIINDYEVTERDLENIYDTLILCGAGQFVNGYYVAAECLIKPKILRWILGHYKDGEFRIGKMDHYESMFFVTDQLLNMFLSPRSYF